MSTIGRTQAANMLAHTSIPSRSGKLREFFQGLLEHNGYGTLNQSWFAGTPGQASDHLIRLRDAGLVVLDPAKPGQAAHIRHWSPTPELAEQMDRYAAIFDEQARQYRRNDRYVVVEVNLATGEAHRTGVIFTGPDAEEHANYAAGLRTRTDRKYLVVQIDRAQAEVTA